MTEYSLSVEETNKLRARLGLPLLESNQEDNEKLSHDKEKLDETFEMNNESNMKTNNDLNTKINITSRFQSLADDTDDNVRIWAENHKSIMGSNIEPMHNTNVEHSKNQEKIENKDDTFLNMKVRHDEKFIEKGNETVLTLTDKNVLDEGEDQLESTQLAQLEKVWKKENAMIEQLDRITSDEGILSTYDEQLNNTGFKLADMSTLTHDTGNFVDLKLGQKVGSDFLSIEELKNRKSRKNRSSRKRKRDTEISVDAQSNNIVHVSPQDLPTTIDNNELQGNDISERRNQIIEKEKARRSAYDFSVNKAQEMTRLNLATMDDDLDADALLKLERAKKKRRIDTQPINILNRTKELEKAIKNETEENETIDFVPDVAVSISNAEVDNMDISDETPQLPVTILDRKKKSHSLRTKPVQDNEAKENIMEDNTPSNEKLVPISQTLLKEPILNRGLYNAIIYARQKGFLKTLQEPTSSISEDSIEKKKEEFKKLNYAFYGMQKSKSKLEREKKKKERQKRIQGMSTTDTPLNALQALRNAQEASGTAFISVGSSMDVLSTAVAAHKLARQKRKQEVLES